MGVAKEGGPLMTGCLVASILGGLYINQAAFYMHNFKRDPWYNKALVGFFLVLIVLDWAAYFHILFHLFILEPGVNELPNDADHARPIVLFCPTVATFLSEMFFSFRCWLLTGKRRVVGILLGTMTTVVFVLGVVTVVYASINTSLKDGNVMAVWEKWYAASLWLAAATDITITTLLCIALWPKRQGLSDRTDSLISRVVILSVTTAALSAVLYIADSIAMIFQIQEGVKVGNVEDAFLCILPHVSALVVCGTLNLRRVIQTPSGPMYSDHTMPAATIIAESAGAGSGGSRRWQVKHPEDIESAAVQTIPGDAPIALSLARAASGSPSDICSPIKGSVRSLDGPP